MNVFIVAALTADGFIGRDGSHTADWTGSADKKVFVRLTKQAGTIVMGSNTFKTIGKALPGRRNIVYTRNQSSIHVDGIETTSEPPGALVQRLAKEGANALAVCGGARIYDMFLRAEIVDDIYLTIVPQLFGTGLSLSITEMDIKLDLVESENLEDGCILLHYKIARN